MVKENTELVQELTKNSFEEFIKKGVVLVDFFADWCMPCMMMSPVVEDLAEKFKGKIKFGKVNVGEGEQELAQKYKVSSIPHFIVFKDGRIIEQFMGSIGEDEFEEKLNSLM